MTVALLHEAPITLHTCQTSSGRNATAVSLSVTVPGKNCDRGGTDRTGPHTTY